MNFTKPQSVWVDHEDEDDDDDAKEEEDAMQSLNNNNKARRNACHLQAVAPIQVCMCWVLHIAEI